MNHGTIDSAYICLSYVWGTDGVLHQISINNKLFLVRTNLHEFLKIARTMYSLTAFWIDALCIAQDDEVERNHQVQQMGLIYSNAKLVISWLGTSSLAAAFFTVALQYKDQHDGIAPWFRKFPEGMDAMTCLNEVIHNEYWSRAWIIQEVLRGRPVIVQVNEYNLDLSVLAQLARNRIRAFELTTQPPFIAFEDVSNNDIIGKSLLELLHHFRHSNCLNSRDRIYSLLSLCGEGADLNVNYGISDGDFIFEILKVCPRSLCICSVAVVWQCLRFYAVDEKTQMPPRCDTPLFELNVKPSATFLSPFRIDHLCPSCGFKWWFHDESEKCVRVFCLENECRTIGGHLIYESGSVFSAVHMIFVPTREGPHAISYKRASFDFRLRSKQVDPLRLRGVNVTREKTGSSIAADWNISHTLAFSLRALLRMVHEKEKILVTDRTLGPCESSRMKVEASGKASRLRLCA